MKTIKLVFTVVAAAITTMAAAIENPKVNLVPLSDERAAVTVKNAKPAFFEVSIKAENGDLVYYKQTENPSTDYKQIYDFTDLADGTYVLNLEVEGTKVTNNFEVSRNGIEVGEAQVRFAPYFDFNNDELKLSYLNFDQETLKLYFYNNNELVYKTEVGKDFNITKGYDLSKLQSGSYQVVLSSLNNKYTFDVEK